MNNSPEGLHLPLTIPATTFVCTLFAFAWGMAAALGWPISIGNWKYLLIRGVSWGVVGAILVYFTAELWPDLSVKSRLVFG